MSRGAQLEQAPTATKATRCRASFGKTIRGCGKALKLVLGTEALLNTSLEIGFGVTFASPRLTRLINFNTGAALWSGSVAYHERGTKDVIVDRWLNLDSPMGGVGYSALGKLDASLTALPLVSGYKSTRSHAVYVGVGGAAEIGLGEVGPTTRRDGTRVPGRGPFIESYLSIPVLPLGAVNAFAGMSISFYSPALQPLTRRMKRPAAWLQERGERLQSKLKKMRWRKKRTGKE